MCHLISKVISTNNENKVIGRVREFIFMFCGDIYIYQTSANSTAVSCPIFLVFSFVVVVVPFVKSWTDSDKTRESAVNNGLVEEKTLRGAMNNFYGGAQEVQLFFYSKHHRPSPATSLKNDYFSLLPAKMTDFSSDSCILKKEHNRAKHPAPMMVQYRKRLQNY